MPTNFWLIRHAVVAENERATLYGVRDVQLCPDSLVAQVPMYQALAARLPRPATWLCTPLSRTRRTAEAIFKAGYPAQNLAVEPDLIEQDLGDYQGLRHAALPPLLSAPAHPFWPLAADEQPPNGETFDAVLVRVGAALERLAEQLGGRDVVVVSHGGAIRAAARPRDGHRRPPRPCTCPSTTCRSPGWSAAGRMARGLRPTSRRALRSRLVEVLPQRRLVTS